MFPDFATDEAQSFHHKLARFNVIRMAPATPSSDWQATTRRYAYQAIGAFGVIELTAPERARKVAFGMQRLGLGARGPTSNCMRCLTWRMHAAGLPKSCGR